MSSPYYKVYLLQEGYEYFLPNGNSRRQCNSVLLNGPYIVLINPGLTFGYPEHFKELNKYGVSSPTSVNYVVCSDGKALHAGSLCHFTGAETIIVGHDIQKPRDIFVEHDFTNVEVPFELCKDVLVFGVSDTSQQHVYVLVLGILFSNHTTRCNSDTRPSWIAISGSVFASQENICNITHSTLPKALFETAGPDSSCLRQTKNHILTKADWIVPDIGPPFKANQNVSKGFTDTSLRNATRFPKFISKAISSNLKCPQKGLISWLIHNSYSSLFNASLIKYTVDACNLKVGETVLEIGCGNGRGLHLCAQKVAPRISKICRYSPAVRMLGVDWKERFGFRDYDIFSPLDEDGHIIGVDVSEYAIISSRRSLRTFLQSGHAEVHYSCVQNLPLLSSCVDVCFHVDNLFFWPSYELALRQIWRVLRPNGRLVTAFAASRLRAMQRLDLLAFARLDFLGYAMALERSGFTDVVCTKTPNEGIQSITCRKPPIAMLTASLTPSPPL